MLSRRCLPGFVATERAALVMNEYFGTTTAHVSEIAVLRYEKGRPFVGSCREKNHDNYSTLTR
jgi:hypothetical protein